MKYLKTYENYNTLYKEIEFVCVNSDSKTATNKTNQENLYKELKNIPDVYSYRQDFSDGKHEEISLAVIILSKENEKELEKQILNLAKKNNVEFDLINYRNDNQVDQIIKGEYYDNILENLNSENYNLLFIRTKKFDNSGTIRELPYKGIQCWCIIESDKDKYIKELELWGGNRKDIEIIDPSNYNIFALYYPNAHKYVMGKTNILHGLEPFDKNKHVLKFIKQPKKSLLSYIADMKYQIILKK